MSLNDSLYGVDLDYASGAATLFAPTSGRIGSAAASAQGARVVAFSGPSGKLAQANVDANGNLTVVPTGPGGSGLTVTAGTTPPALASQNGYLMFGRQDSPAPASYQPLLMDPVGAANVHLKSKATFRAMLAQVSAAQNKSLFSIFNGSASQIVRVQEIGLYITPQSVGGALLGSASVIYYPVYCQLHRITGHAAQTGTSSSTAITPMAADLADTLDSGVTCYANAALTGLSAGGFHRGDANNSRNFAWYGRGDPNEKTVVLRPGQGIAVICVSNGIIANGSGTQLAVVDVEAVFTQALG